MTKKEKLKILQKLSEQDLTKDFLIPLFESEGIGFRSVRYTHKALEFGKDVVYYEKDACGDRIYTAVQVKKTVTVHRVQLSGCGVQKKHIRFFCLSE